MIVEEKSNFINRVTFLFRRYVVNKELFSDLVQRAHKHPDHWYQIGGNAPVMASRFAKEGATVLLGAHNSDFMASRVHKNIRCK